MFRKTQDVELAVDRDGGIASHKEIISGSSGETLRHRTNELSASGKLPSLSPLSNSQKK